ncbi:3-oxo-tetronate kinase [Paraburkholderia sp.]|uniref:3-oxo-tetronate kinase n=1 Tax=Paraburkholderia sp. TaxID=1926495 RepID=UPI00238BBC83|nr:3-oxo-tetronate kinase [Paraburkholderia sp.]MDE1179828.1 four-carbon acid sugar kinase family protein [Paraburkholderia sp.]
MSQTLNASARANARPLLGCIADDFTGATDLANMLVRGGMRTVQTIGVPASADQLEADALVVALKSRTIGAADAVAQSRAALDWLRAQGCRQFFFKYCSTFDSTDAGNIGPVADALLDALDTSASGISNADSHGFTIACPAFPENGRTVYRGHLFVGDTLLSESGMENHPLTPMTDPNLVRVLQRQTASKVGLIRYDTIARGVDAVRDAIAGLRADGVRIAIADALTDADLHTLGAACADLPLITGGSGVALGLPDNFQRAGLIDANDTAGKLGAIDGASVVLAGSASKATNAQVAEWLKQRPGFRIDPLALARGEPVVERALAFFAEHADTAPGIAPQTVLIYATATPDEVKAVQRELGVAAAGQLVEDALASVARQLRERGVRRFVVAGGETSGAVVQALDVKMLRIGAQIDPGVPATASVGDTPLALALKSGNFGTVDFFDKALRHLAGGAQ